MIVKIDHIRPTYLHYLVHPHSTCVSHNIVRATFDYDEEVHPRSRSKFQPNTRLFEAIIGHFKLPNITSMATKVHMISRRSKVLTWMHNNIDDNVMHASV